MNLFKVLCFAGVVVLLMSMADDKKTKVVFFGDSITQAGVKPGGYIAVLGDMLYCTYILGVVKNTQGLRM